ncbi:hypothetical protein C8R46DRAFT_1098721 [Mycena filopes]|nr:hypothetical protein C8R46DRAFT_1098721 [Mycena filopes]
MDPAIPTPALGTYARDADEAEAQPPKVGLATTNEKTTPAIHDDKHANFAPTMDQAKMFDDNLANLFNSDLDPLLIFAGLFSAILAAFLIEIRKGLQEDLQSVTNNLLIILIQNQQNITAASTSANNFTPSASSRWVNGLWFSSLMFSLMSALGASLAKGWITQFSASVSGSSWGDALLHAQRYRGLQRWHLKVVIQCLPIPIHIAFFLFSIGLVILLFQDDIAIGVVISALTGLILSLYIASSTHPVFSPDSPFRTPVSGMLHRLMDRSWRFVLFPPFPDRNDAQKAHALTWLVAESPNVDTVNAAIRAIAGLPANPIVQDALFGDTNAALLLRILSANLLKRSPDNELISSCLYALLHLVQTAHLPSSASKFLQEAVLSGGPLADTDQMPAGLRELAFCVKSRIILLHSAPPLNITLFDDILILIHACSDSHLRRMLIEICILSQQMSKSSASTLDFLAILRNPASVNREQIHGKLVKEASSERYLTDVVASFGAATLVEGLTTGSYRTQYAKLFAELTEASAFVKQLAWNGSESTLKLFRTLPVIDENGQRDILRGLHHLITSANGRQVLAIGLPVIIDCIDSPNPVLSAEAAQLVNESASHDDLRNVISTSDLSTRLHHIMTTPPSVKHHYTDSFESCSLTLLDAFENLTAGGELHLGIRPELVLSLLLKRIGAPMMGYDEPNDIIIRFLQRDNLHLALFCVDAVPQIRGMLGDPSWDIQLGTIELLAALVHEDRVRHLLYSPELFPSIVALLHGDGMNFRELSKAVTKMITTLVVHETPLDLDKIEKIVDMVKPDCNVRETLEVIQALARYDEIRPTMLTLGIMPKILACCKLDYVAHTTLIALVAYGRGSNTLSCTQSISSLDDIRPAISIQMLQMEILAMLKGENTNKTIQRWTMVSVRQLSQYGIHFVSTRMSD